MTQGPLLKPILFTIPVNDLGEGSEDGYTKVAEEMKMLVIEKSTRINNIWRNLSERQKLASEIYYYQWLAAIGVITRVILLIKYYNKGKEQI